MIPPLCFITDPDAPHSIPEQAEAAMLGGAAWVQLRHKTLPDAEFAGFARLLIEVLAPSGAKLIVNDRVDVARQVGASGLHIGQGDGDPVEIRARIGPDMVLGLSVENDAQLPHLPDCVDYLGVGPVFGTSSKADAAPAIGMDGLARICAATKQPCMAIGGLSASDIPDLRKTGCDGVAVVSAISRAPDMETAARDFVKNWRKS